MRTRVFRFIFFGMGPQARRFAIGVIIITIFLLSSCVMDFHSSFAIVKNNTHSPLLIAELSKDSITDNILYNERFAETWIEPNKSTSFSRPNVKLKSLPDSIKTYIYIFNHDSLYKYQTLKKIEGIVKHSFIQRIEIQLNKVKAPLDTICVK